MHGLLRVDQPSKPSQPVVVFDQLPGERAHEPTTLRFAPDGWLYVAVGAPCNACVPDARHGLMAQLDVTAAKPQREVVARGIRNSVGFDGHPVTHELWFTDNGRDLLGDDVPGDELNRLSGSGTHFGFPYCHQGNVPNPQFGGQRQCAEFAPPVQVLGAHVAALGMRFYTGTLFPEEYRRQIFIAEHDSWNRSAKAGYRIALVRLNGNQAVSYLPFAFGRLKKGRLRGEQAWGRPVDVLVMPDGALLVSDDYADAIYRIDYQDDAGNNAGKNDVACGDSSHCRLVLGRLTLSRWRKRHVNQRSHERTCGACTAGLQTSGSRGGHARW